MAKLELYHGHSDCTQSIKKSYNPKVTEFCWNIYNLFAELDTWEYIVFSWESIKNKHFSSQWNVNNRWEGDYKAKP